MLRRILLTSAGAAALTTAAAAADLGAKAPPPPYVPPPPVLTWTGFYAGLSVGGTWLANKSITTTAVNVFPGYGILDPGDDEDLIGALSQSGTAGLHNSGGVIGGGQVGYNFQFANNFVVGIEADISGTNARANGFVANSVPDLFAADFANAVITSSKAVDWLGTVRGRLGWLVTPTLLLYGDGGLAYGGTRGATFIHSFWTPGGFDTAGDAWTDAFGQFDQTRVGWTAGGGIEWMFMPNWSLKVEYLYYDLGRVTWANSANSSFSTITTDALGNAAGTVISTNVSTSTTRFNGNIVRAGLNYHFNWGAPPVVAKY